MLPNSLIGWKWVGETMSGWCCNSLVLGFPKIGHLCFVLGVSIEWWGEIWGGSNVLWNTGHALLEVLQHSWILSGLALVQVILVLESIFDFEPCILRRAWGLNCLKIRIWYIFALGNVVRLRPIREPVSVVQVMDQEFGVLILRLQALHEGFLCERRLRLFGFPLCSRWTSLFVCH